jgi:hypothetical protein
MGEWSDYGVPGQDFPGSATSGYDDPNYGADDMGSDFGYDPGNAGAYTDQGGLTFDDTGQAYGPDIADPGADWAMDAFAGSGGAMNTGTGWGELTRGVGRLASDWSVGGRNGIVYRGGGGNVATGGDVGGADVDFGDLPGGPPYRVMGAGTSRTAMILRAVAQNVGMRIRLRTIVFMIARLGWQAAARATGLGARDLLYLFLKKKTSRRGRLGPHLRTIEKRCRQADRYRHRVSKLAGRIHAHRAHGGGGHRGRKRARKR